MFGKIGSTVFFLYRYFEISDQNSRNSELDLNQGYCTGCFRLSGRFENNTKQLPSFGDVRVLTSNKRASVIDIVLIGQ